MRNFNRFAVTMLVCTLGSAPAFAQDEPVGFNGFYVSGAVGITMQGGNDGDSVVFDTNRDGSFNENVVTTLGANAFTPGFCAGSSTSATPGSCREDRKRIDYGVRLGLDSRIGESLVVGALVEVSKNDSVDGTTAFSTTPAGYSFERQLDYAISGRARIGFTPGGRALIYGTGGVSYARIDHKFFTTNTVNSFTATNDRDWVWGYQLGGGGEFMLTDNISIGAEYLYNRYDDDKYFVAIGPGTAAATNPFLLNGGGTNFRPSRSNFDFHTVRATLSFHF